MEDFRIKDLPEGLKMLALMEQQAQGNDPNDDLHLAKTAMNGNFLWHESSQGYNFWKDVCSIYNTGGRYFNQIYVSQIATSFVQKLGKGFNLNDIYLKI